MDPTPAVLPYTPTKYTERFRAVYHRSRSRAVARRRQSTTKALAPHTDPHRDGGFPLTVPPLLVPSGRHRRPIPSFSTDSPQKRDCTGPRNERRQRVQSQCRRPAI